MYIDAMDDADWMWSDPWVMNSGFVAEWTLQIMW
jgi:hypothetical protein